MRTKRSAGRWHLLINRYLENPMATGSITPASVHSAEFLPPECLPNYESLITEDDKPVDNIYSERQLQLLTTTLHDSWEGPCKGEPRFVASDVGLFFADRNPAFAPDVLISLGVAPPQENHLAKENRSYFVWRYNKPPDLNLEVVSNLVGGELTTKLLGYARMGVIYYVVWDPESLLSERKLHCFALERGKYVPCDPWFPILELGVKVWEGVFGDMHATFLRWCDLDGNILPTGAERAEHEKQRAEHEKQRAEHEKQRAEHEKQRAEHEKQRADKLAEKLRALGVNPDAA
jgi:Uma2 family endonuclease